MKQRPSNSKKPTVPNTIADTPRKNLRKRKRHQTPQDRSAMDFKDRHTQYAPTVILDVDNGVDFTFKGMGLGGNR